MEDNYSFYKAKIIQQISQYFGIDKNGNLLKCFDRKCEECVLKRENETCASLKNYLLEEHVEYPTLAPLQYELLKRYAGVGYKYIARDSNKEEYMGRLVIYAEKPHKRTSYWIPSKGSKTYKVIDPDLDCFDFVSWKDKSPWEIQKLLDNCEIKNERQG